MKTKVRIFSIWNEQSVDKSCQTIFGKSHEITLEVQACYPELEAPFFYFSRGLWNIFRAQVCGIKQKTLRIKIKENFVKSSAGEFSVNNS